VCFLWSILVSILEDGQLRVRVHTYPKDAGAKAKVARCSVVCSASGQFVQAICAEVELEMVVMIRGGGGVEPNGRIKFTVRERAAACESAN
jgi:hypothetical protein